MTSAPRAPDASYTATVASVGAAMAVERLARGRERRTAVLGALLLSVALFEGTRLSPALRREPAPGYVEAARALDAQPLDVPLLLVTQDFVWTTLERGARALHLPSERANAVLDGADEVLLVFDLHTFSREKPWDLVPLEEVLAQRPPLLRFALSPGLDALQNNLTLDELERFAEDAALRERCLTIRAWRLSAEEVRGLLEAHARLR